MSNPIKTKVYYVSKQPSGMRVYAVLISEHDDGMFYGSILYVQNQVGAHGTDGIPGLEQPNEMRGNFIPGATADEVKKFVLKWMEEKNAKGCSLIEK